MKEILRNLVILILMAINLISFIYFAFTFSIAAFPIVMNNYWSGMKIMALIVIASFGHCYIAFNLYEVGTYFHGKEKVE